MKGRTGSAAGCNWSPIIGGGGGGGGRSTTDEKNNYSNDCFQAKGLFIWLDYLGKCEANWTNNTYTIFKRFLNFF